MITQTWYSRMKENRSIMTALYLNKCLTQIEKPISIYTCTSISALSSKLSAKVFLLLLLQCFNRFRLVQPWYLY